MIRGEQDPVPRSQGLLKVLYSPELDIHNTMPALQRRGRYNWTKCRQKRLSCGGTNSYGFSTMIFCMIQMPTRAVTWTSLYFFRRLVGGPDDLHRRATLHHLGSKRGRVDQHGVEVRTGQGQVHQVTA
jgi:hypothetical protein